MNRVFMTLSLALTASVGTVAEAASTGVTSDAAAMCAGLLTPTEIDQRRSVFLSYAYNRLRSSSDRRSGKSDNGINIPGVGEATGSETFENESKRLEDLGIKWQRDESASYIARFLPANQSSDYLACVVEILHASDSSVGLELNDVTGDAANFNLRIQPTPGIDIRRKVLIWTNGGPPQGEWRDVFGPGSHNVGVSIKWPDPGKPLVIRAQMAQVDNRNRRTGMIGKPARFIVWPEITETPIAKKSGTGSARYPNRHPPGRYLSGDLSVSAEASEVLIPYSAREIDGNWLPPTWGAKRGLTCTNNGIVLDPKNDGLRVAGKVFCDGGYSDEDPGYSAAIQVRGVRFSVVQPNPNVTMDEKKFE